MSHATIISLHQMMLLHYVHLKLTLFLQSLLWHKECIEPFLPIGSCRGLWYYDDDGIHHDTSDISCTIEIDDVVVGLHFSFFFIQKQLFIIIPYYWVMLGQLMYSTRYWLDRRSDRRSDDNLKIAHNTQRSRLLENPQKLYTEDRRS